MKLTKKLALAMPAAAIALGGGASGAVADDFDTETNILNCNIIEVIDLRLISGAPNNIDCSEEVDINEFEATKVVTKSHR